MPVSRPRAPRTLPVLTPRVNRAHPLTRGLAWLVVPPIHRGNLIDGGLPTSLGTTNWTSTTRVGRGMGTANGTGNGAAWPWSPRVGRITTQMTMVCWFQPVSGGINNPGAVWVVPYNASNFTAFGAVAWHFGGAGASTSRYYQRVPDTFVDSSAGFVQDTDGLMLYGLTRNNGTVNFYRNGVFHSGSTNGTLGTTAVDWGSHPEINVQQRDSADQGWSNGGTTMLVAVWDRSLSAAELALLATDPYILVSAPPHRGLRVPLTTVAGTGAATWDAWTSSGAGALPLTAQQAATLGAWTAGGAGALPLTAQLAAAWDAWVGSGAGTLPLIGVGAGTLGAWGSSGAGVLPLTGAGAATLDPWTALGAGVIGQFIEGTGTAAWAAWVGSAAGQVALRAVGAATLGTWTATGHGGAPGTGPQRGHVRTDGPYAWGRVHSSGPYTRGGVTGTPED